MLSILGFAQAEHLAGHCQWDGSSWLWQITQLHPFWQLRPRQVRVTLNGDGLMMEWLDRNGNPIQHPQRLVSLDELIEVLNQ